MNILGLNGWMDRSHDASAALLLEGKIVAAAEEERFVRVKKAYDRLPINATSFCLEEGNLTFSDIDYVAFGWDWKRLYSLRHIPYQWDEETLLESMFPRKYFKRGKNPRVKFIDHHLAHAASTFRCSGFDTAAILVLDGQGEDCSISLWDGQGNHIREISRIGIPNSLGYFYSAITRYLGMSNGNEGKLMGLASYGSPDSAIVEELRKIRPRLTEEDFNGTPDEQDQVEQYWMDALIKRFGPRNEPVRYFDKDVGAVRKHLELTEIHKAIAASAQCFLEEKVVQLVRDALQMTSREYLCLAGGVALNCVANQRIIDNTGVKRIYVQPAANDAGVALGAALETYALLGNFMRVPLEDVGLGPGFSDEEIERELSRCGVSYTFEREIEKVCADLLQQDNIIGWFQGRMEFGPRALGYRSIIANPTSKGMIARINNQIKNRELWRPFAPSVLREYASDYFVTPDAFKFMIVSSDVAPGVSEKIPAVVHVDGSARPHAVDRLINPRFYDLINNFYQLSGVPMVLNTSFNVDGEPIVCTPRDAVKTFFSTGLDSLVMGNYLVRK